MADIVNINKNKGKAKIESNPESKVCDRFIKRRLQKVYFDSLKQIDDLLNKKMD